MRYFVVPWTCDEQRRSITLLWEKRRKKKFGEAFIVKSNILFIAYAALLTTLFT
jgi:hypothetical protein